MKRSKKHIVLIVSLWALSQCAQVAMSQQCYRVPITRKAYRSRAPGPPPAPPAPVAAGRTLAPPAPAPSRPRVKQDPWHFGKTVRLPVVQQIPASSRSRWDADCGQYVIAALMTSLGHDVDREMYDSIGRVVNPKQSGVSASRMIAYLKPYVESVRSTAADFDDVKQQIDRGLPAILAVKTPRAGHWILVVGYTTNGKGEVQTWHVVDNGVLNGPKSHRELKEMWDQRGNVCILVKPKGKYPVELDHRIVQSTEVQPQPVTRVKPPAPVKPSPPAPVVRKAAPPKPVVRKSKPEKPVASKPVPSKPVVRKPVAAPEKPLSSFERLVQQKRRSAETPVTVSQTRKSDVEQPAVASKPTIKKLLPPGTMTRVYLGAAMVYVLLFAVSFKMIRYFDRLTGYRCQ